MLPTFFSSLNEDAISTPSTEAGEFRATQQTPSKPGTSVKIDDLPFSNAGNGFNTASEDPIDWIVNFKSQDYQEYTTTFCELFLVEFGMPMKVYGKDKNSRVRLSCHKAGDRKSKHTNDLSKSRLSSSKLCGCKFIFTASKPQSNGYWKITEPSATTLRAVMATESKGHNHTVERMQWTARYGISRGIDEKHVPVIEALAKTHKPAAIRQIVASIEKHDAVKQGVAPPRLSPYVDFANFVAKVRQADNPGSADELGVTRGLEYLDSCGK
ncbi:hypothetical protein BJ741DRAFT_686463 [Chytriomyces cf. hyalinus JEL632]|nr:hypothetical protein BJ741DRAFT_686463 [Chytriomyces cf. hyalinus JEL632]